MSNSAARRNAPITVPRHGSLESANVDRALRIVAVGIARDGDQTVDVSLARCVGERDGVVAVLEVIDTRLEPVAEILEPLGVLFSGVRWAPRTSAAPGA